MWKKIFLHCSCDGEKNVIVENISPQTGYDRVREMFIRSDYGLVSPQLYFLVQNAASTVVISFFFGAFIHMKNTKDDYFRRNVASTYESQYLAKRKLTDTVTLNGVKGGLKFALKYGSFSSLYMLCTMTAASYNNKITIWEHIGSGALLGALYRFNFGLKGMAAAAGLGGVLGAFAGGALVSCLWFKKIDFQDLLNAQNDSYYQMRRRNPAHNY